MTAIRIFIAGLTVMLILAFMKKIRRLSKREILAVAFTSILGVVLHHGLLAFGLANTTAVKGGIILGFSPLVTAILALLFKFTKMSALRFFGFILGTTGVIISVLNGDESVASIQLGDILVFLSIVSQAFSFLLISKISKTIESVVLTGYMLFFGSLILIVLSLITEPQEYMLLLQAPNWVFLVLFASAILATAVGHVIYNYAISHIGAAETAIFGNFNTLFGLLGTAFILGEVITNQQIFGCVFIIFGVLIGTGTLQELMRKRNIKLF